MSGTPVLPPEVVARVRELLDAVAEKDGLREPTAFTLATADARGRPSTRTVLLKGFDEQGFVFYTNLNSRKGEQLRENPWASLTFFWQGRFEQIHVEGAIEYVADEEADAYWATRPRPSQIGAWASDQSKPLKNRAQLLASVVSVAARFGVGDVPRPTHWTGVRVRPERVEFWKAGEFRLHDRQCWTLSGADWTCVTLSP